MLCFFVFVVGGGLFWGFVVVVIVELGVVGGFWGDRVVFELGVRLGVVVVVVRVGVGL